MYGILLNAIVAFLMNSYYSGKLIDFNTFQQIKLIIPLLFINFIAASAVFVFSKQILHLPDLLQLVIGMSGGYVFYFILILIFERRILKIGKEIISSSWFFLPFKQNLIQLIQLFNYFVQYTKQNHENVNYIWAWFRFLLSNVKAEIVNKLRMWIWKGLL